MNQAELRLMAEERIEDARVLVAGHRWTFAYHTTGVAVECALKSCVLARMIYTGWVFDEVIQLGGQARKVKEVTARTHDFTTLLELAGLKGDLDADAAADSEFQKRWGAVAKWTVESRYLPKSRGEAETLYEAVAEPTHGVLRWLKRHW